MIGSVFDPGNPWSTGVLGSRASQAAPFDPKWPHSRSAADTGSGLDAPLAGPKQTLAVIWQQHNATPLSYSISLTNE